MRFHSPQFLLAISWIFKSKKIMFCFLNCTLELLPVFDPFGLSVILQLSITVFIPPCLGVFSDINNFWMFIPSSFYIISESYYNMFKDFFPLNILHIKPFDGFNSIVDKFIFFFTILDYCMLFGLNILFKNCNIHSKWDVIRCKILVWVNGVIVMFLWIWSEKH